jgi:uncharacterized protein
MTAPRLGAPDLGVGVGLRAPHHEQIIAERPRVDWFECISENFMLPGGKPLAHLDAVRQSYRVVLHGVSLDLGGPEPLDASYIRQLRALVDRVAPPWVSDHLCWNGAGGLHLHELMPLPMTAAAVAHVAARVDQVQQALGLRFAIENVSSYLTYRADEMPEWEFLSRVAEAADCGILLDVNNVYVSSRNHGFDPALYIESVPHDRVVQMHLAGHEDRGRYLLDTHADHVCEAVWALYRRACQKIGPCSTLIEWDDDIPSLDVLLAEADRARSVRDAACDPAPGGPPDHLAPDEAPLRA